MALQIEVWGKNALFTRAEMKTERVSYDVITPSAARGLIESIYFHPGLRVVIDRIRVCNPIRFTNVRRNEVKSTISARTVKAAMERGKGELYISTSDDIQQRASMILTDVRYIIDFHFKMTDQANETDNPGKYQDIFKRRIKKGQFYSQPYFGCREFPAHFKMWEGIYTCPEELKGRHDLGYMLYDMDYSDENHICPMYFRAVLNNGSLIVPRADSEEVKR